MSLVRGRSARLAAVVLAAALALVGFSSSSAFAIEMPAAPWVECNPADVTCDVDGDRIPNLVEEAVCGSATCATGREDRDGDGLADWVEFQASGKVAGVDAKADVDGDSIPDFVERIVCGSARCSTGREDTDGDGVGDWAEVVICGDTTCATGQEDYDGDGIKDSAELSACVIYGRGEGWLASTGVRLGLFAVLVAGLVGGGLLLRSRRSRRIAGLVDAL